MDYKERWCALYEEFEEEHGREPTAEEMNEAWGDYCGSIIDAHEEL